MVALRATICRRDVGVGVEDTHTTPAGGAWIASSPHGRGVLDAKGCVAPGRDHQHVNLLTRTTRNCGMLPLVWTSAQRNVGLGEATRLTPIGDGDTMIVAAHRFHRGPGFFVAMSTARRHRSYPNIR